MLIQFQLHDYNYLITQKIYLKGLSEKTGSRIFGKAEFQNPGGSVKDRAALWLVRDAEEKGLYVVVFVLGAVVNIVIMLWSTALNQEGPSSKELRATLA